MLILVGTLSLVFIIFYIKKTTNYWKQRNIIGPKPIPIFGNIKESVLRRKHLATIHQEIYNDFPDEKVVGIYSMTSPALLIRDLEIVKQILVKDFNCFSERGLIISKEKLGDSLFHCNSNTWRVLRGKLTPYFSSIKLKSSFGTLSECGDRFIEYIEGVSDGEPEQELHQLFRKFSIDATLSGIFNVKIDNYSGDTIDFFDKLHKSIFTKSYLDEMSMLYSDFMKLTNSSLFGETAVKFCHDIVKNASDHRNNNSVKKSIMDMLIDLKNEKVPTDLIAKCKATDDLISSQVFILFAAGYENTDLSLSYAFYHLAKNIDVQDTLIEEIDILLKKNNETLTYGALNGMTYLDKVFNETLRINPPANTLQRKAMEDYIIPGTDIRIEKGITVLISPLAIHRDEKYYADPYKFDPERFNSDNIRNRNSCAFLPFGLGPRSCFGELSMLAH